MNQPIRVSASEPGGREADVHGQVRNRLRGQKKASLPPSHRTAMHPVLFSIGDTPIHAYGFFIAVALIVGWITSLKFARDDKLPADQLGTNYVISVAAGLLGGRAMWLMGNRDGTTSELLGAMIQLEAGGLSGFGGVLVGLIVTGLLCQNKKVPTWAWLDCVAPAFLLGVVLERVAAFLSGTDFGHYVDPNFFLSVQFPAGSPVYEIQRRDLTGLRMGPDQSLPVHPSQLYAAGAAAVGALLSFVLRAKRRYSGQVALFAIGFYGVVRYVIEDPFRYDATPEVLGPLSLGQITGAVLVAVVVATHVSRTKRLAEDPSGLVQWTGGPWTPGTDAPKSGGAAKSGAAKSDGAKSDGAKKKSGKKKSGKKSSSSSVGADAKPSAADAKPSGADSIAPDPKPTTKPDAETKPD
jgi:phosphatidylglycerol:prolipoprotein diacylglycerol transferase